MLRASISLRTAAQRRSSSAIEVGNSTRSMGDIGFLYLTILTDDTAEISGQCKVLRCSGSPSLTRMQRPGIELCIRQRGGEADRDRLLRSRFYGTWFGNWEASSGVD